MLESYIGNSKHFPTVFREKSEYGTLGWVLIYSIKVGCEDADLAGSDGNQDVPDAVEVGKVQVCP